MIARLALVLALTSACCSTALAQAVDVDDFSDQLHLEHYAVSINGVEVSSDTAVYYADDETIYVAAADLDTWRLKRPPTPAFERDATPYYGLQTDLQLATSFDERTESVEIIAPRSAFVGERTSTQRIDPGRGAFVNYQLQRQNGSYDFYLAGKGVFETRYLSTAEDGLEFHRARTRWWYPDPVRHTVLSIGEATSGDNWLGTSAPFAGIHYASDFSSDPNYAAHEPLSVSGVAATPSQLEVYVDNALVLRRDVPQGPFTVRDLPPSAAFSDIVMVLTDANGKRSLQIARPVVDPDFLARGKFTFATNAGIGQQRAALKNTYYRGGVLSTNVRFGVTDRITAEVYGESINGENFADAGSDFRLGPDETLQFRIGGGNMRHASQYRYNLRRGKFTIKEQLSLNSLKVDPAQGFDFDSISEVQENTEFSVDFSRFISFGVRFNRSVTSDGSKNSLLSARSRFRRGNFTVEVTPFYDFVRRRTYGNIGLFYRMGSTHRIEDRTAVTSKGDISTALAYRKEQAGPGDPIALDVQVSANRSQDRRFTISDDSKWMRATFNFQQLNGRNLYEPSVDGALAFVGGRLYPLRTVSDSESFGVVHLGLPRVRVTVNDAFAGATDSRGDLLVRDLAPYRANLIDIAEQDVPLNVNIADPQHVVPASVSPLSLSVRVLARSGFTMTVVDANGAVLPPGSLVLNGSNSYLTGYHGRVFVTDVPAGAQRFTANPSGAPCSFEVNVPAQTDDLPDLGKQICR